MLERHDRLGVVARKALDDEHLRVGRHQHGVGARHPRHVGLRGEQLHLQVVGGVVGARRPQRVGGVLVAVLLREERLQRSHVERRRR